MNVQYDSRNQISVVTYSNGYVINYSYDSHGNLTHQTVTVPNLTPLSPTEFNLVNTGSSISLSWEPVTSSVGGSPITVSSYTIEASDNPYSGFTQIGTTTQTQYVDTNDTLSKRFYRIIAVVNSSRTDIDEEEPQSSSPVNDK